MKLIKKDLNDEIVPDTISLDVSLEIVHGSTQQNFNRCMVAEAVKQKFPGASYIYVDARIIRFTLNGVRRFYLPPTVVSAYIAKFDRGEEILPFKFKAQLVKSVPSGFYETHPKGDNRTNPNKRYLATEKKRRYAQRVRVNGVCEWVPVKN